MRYSRYAGETCLPCTALQLLEVVLNQSLPLHYGVKGPSHLLAVEQFFVALEGDPEKVVLVEYFGHLHQGVTFLLLIERFSPELSDGQERIQPLDC